VGRFAALRLRPKNMAHHISQLESELQNIPEAAPKASPSFSVSERLARYGSSALAGVEHLTLLVGKESVALALIRHFGSLKGLARASFQELRQFLPRRSAEAVVAALCMSAIAETEHARSEQLDNPQSIYRACADIKLFNQEVLRVILLDTRYSLDPTWISIPYRKGDRPRVRIVRTVRGEPSFEPGLPVVACDRAYRRICKFVRSQSPLGRQ
jgi:hypothetical protein